MMQEKIVSENIAQDWYGFLNPEWMSIRSEGFGVTMDSRVNYIMDEFAEGKKHYFAPYNDNG